MSQKTSRKAQPPVNNNPQKKKGGFNFYWFYGIVALGILLVGMFGMEQGPKKIGSDRLNKMVRDHAIEKIVIVKQKEEARIFLNSNAVNLDSDYVKAFEINKNGPHYVIEITESADFKQDVRDMEMRAYRKDTIGMDAEAKELGLWLDNLAVPHVAHFPVLLPFHPQHDPWGGRTVFQHRPLQGPVV